MAYFRYSSTGAPELAPDDTPWADFLVRSLRATDDYQKGRTQELRGPLAPGSTDPLETQAWLSPLIGEIRPYLSDEAIKGMSEEDQKLVRDWRQGAEYASTARDRSTIFHDPFFHAVMALGIIGGATAGAGAGAGAAGGAGGGAGGSGSAGLLAGTGAEAVSEAALPGLTGAAGTVPTWATTASQIAPYLSYGGQGINALGQLTGNQGLSQFGRALSYAGTAAGAAGGAGAGDWGKVGTAAVKTGAPYAVKGVTAQFQPQVQPQAPGQPAQISTADLMQLAGLQQQRPWAPQARWLG